MRKFTARTVLGAGLAFGLGFAGAACGGPDVPDSTSSAFMAGDEDAHFNTAMEHWASGDFDAAEASLLMATQANPRYLAAHMALGDLYLSQGRFADARERFEEAVTLRDRSLDAHLGLARALRGLDENTTALVHAERAWALVDDFVTEDLRAETLLVLGVGRKSILRVPARKKRQLAARQHLVSRMAAAEGGIRLGDKRVQVGCRPLPQRNSVAGAKHRPPALADRGNERGLRLVLVVVRRGGVTGRQDQERRGR